MNVFCHICGRLVDLIGLQPQGVPLCTCASKMQKYGQLQARISELEAEIERLTNPKRAPDSITLADIPGQEAAR